MQAIHAAEVCHRDLKLENMVLDSNFNLKVIDFGLACPISGSEGSGFCDSSEKCGTDFYMAPEVWLERRYQPTSADMFSLGVILFVLRTGFLPFEKAVIED